MPIESLPVAGSGAIVPIPPGTPTFGLNASGVATTARDGTGAAPVDGGPVGRVLGPNGEVWRAETDEFRATFRADRFGPGLHGIETGIGASTGLRWDGATDFGTGWTMYMVLDLSTYDGREGRILSLTDDASSDDFASVNGFSMKLFPPHNIAFESRLTFNYDTKLPHMPLPTSKITIAHRIGPRTAERHIGSQVVDGSWASAETPTVPTRMQYGYWVARGYIEPTRSILARFDVYNTRHSLDELKSRMTWYRQIYGTV